MSAPEVYQCACGTEISSLAFKRSGKCTKCRKRDKMAEYRAEGKFVTPPVENPMPRSERGALHGGKLNYDVWSHEITYTSAHRRIKSERGAAKTHPCIVCSAPAAEWAYMYCGGEYERFGPRGSGVTGSYYSTRPKDYEPMCVKHHRHHDAVMRDTLEYRVKDLNRAAQEMGQSVQGLFGL